MNQAKITHSYQPFRNRRLSTSESRKVSRMAFLFTDLSDSTALCARKGDLFAYRLVRAHFMLLKEVIKHYGGSVVKTIGDAVMAVFSSPDEALRAALACQEALNAENSQLSKQDRLQLKVGLHSGPCLSATLNQQLDYFGTTVNVAARVQGLAGEGEVVFTDQLRRSLKDRYLLASLSLTKEQLMLRGLNDQSFIVYRTGKGAVGTFLGRNSVKSGKGKHRLA